jgi:hypothetical protein
MRYSAELACRSPPRLSRRRLVLPEDASSGLTPHRAAKDAQPVGVVAGGDEQGRGVVGTDPAASQQGRGVAGDGGGDLVFQVANLASERQDALGLLRQYLPKAPTCQCTPPPTSPASPTASTAGPAKHSDT